MGLTEKPHNVYILSNFYFLAASRKEISENIETTRKTLANGHNEVSGRRLPNAAPEAWASVLRRLRTAEALPRSRGEICARACDVDGPQTIERPKR